MNCRICPECGGAGRQYEPMDKFERAEYGSPRVATWESRCSCCRGYGYILFEMMYPTAAQFRRACKAWRFWEVRLSGGQDEGEHQELDSELEKKQAARHAEMVARGKQAVEAAIEKVKEIST